MLDVTKKDVYELRQSLADLTIVMNDLAKTIRASNTGDRDTQHLLVGGQHTFVGESPHRPLVHIESPFLSLEDEDVDPWEEENYYQRGTTQIDY